MLQELRSGVHILQLHNNQIVAEATDLFNGMQQELEALSKRISDNTLQISAVIVTAQTVQNAISVLTKRIDEVNKPMATITTSLTDVPSKEQLRLNAQKIDEQMMQVANVNTGLTTAIEGYKFWESSPYDFRRTSVTAGPSGMQFVHPQRQSAINRQSLSVSSLRDTESEYSWHARIRGGAGETADRAAGGADGRAAGGADGGAAGGAGGGPPPPPDPPPSDHGGPGGRRMSRIKR